MLVKTSLNHKHFLESTEGSVLEPMKGCDLVTKCCSHGRYANTSFSFRRSKRQEPFSTTCLTIRLNWTSMPERQPEHFQFFRLIVLRDY